MRGRLGLAFAGVASIAAFAAGTALGTGSSGLVGTPIARGTAGAFSMHDPSDRLKLQAKEPIDVVLVKATLTPGGYTGWHGHVTPSLVVVKTGLLTAYEARKGECAVETHAAGTAFPHSADAHNFVAGADGAEFYVVYLVPQGGSPAPIDVTPAPCR